MPPVMVFAHKIIGKAARVQFRPLFEKKLLDVPVEQFLVSLRFQQRGKLDQLGIEIGSFDKESSNISFEFPMGGTDQKSKLNGILYLIQPHLVPEFLEF